MSQWDDSVKEWKALNFSDDDILQEEQRRRKEYFDNGFSLNEIDSYFGVKQFDKEPSKVHFDKNISRMLASQEESKVGNPTAAPKEKSWGEYLAGAWDAADAGWQQGVVSLLNKAPKKLLPEHADMFYRIASQIGQLAGDLPFMVAGTLGGTAAGGALGLETGPGAIATAAIGAGVGFGLPAGMRKILMDHYEKGDVKDFQDFWARASATMIEAGKSFAIGGATAGVGGVTFNTLAKPLAAAAWGGVLSEGAGSAISTSGKILAEVGTMTTLGKALEGQAPGIDDFIEASILVGGLHMAGPAAKLPKALREVYSKYNIKPEEPALASEKNPVLKQEMNSENPDPEKIAALTKEERVPEPPKEVTEVQIEDAKPLEERGKVVRYEEPGVVAGGVEKPQGLYTSPSDVSSPHAELGGAKTEYTKNPNAKVLEVDATEHLDAPKDVRGGGLMGQSTGIAALRTLLGEQEFQRMLKLPKEELLSELKTKYPEVEWARYSDKLEMLEGVAGVEARKAGYDAISGVDTKSPEFSEYVGLNKNAFLEDSKLKIDDSRPPISQEDEIDIGKPPKDGGGDSGEPTPESDHKLMRQFIEEKTPGKKASYKFKDFYRDFVDKLDPVKQAILMIAKDPSVILDGINPYMLARQVNDYKAKVRGFIKHATFEFGEVDGTNTGKVNGKGFTQVVSMAVEKGGTLEGLDNFMAAARGLEIEKSGKQSGLSKEQIEAAKRMTHADSSDTAIYGEAAKEMVQFQNRVLKYCLDAGIISQESHDKMVAAGQAYVPFMRIIDDLVEGGGTLPNPFKKLKGSSENIQSPLLSIQENTERAIRLAEINRAKLSLIKLAESNPDQTLIRPAQKETMKITLSADEFMHISGEEGPLTQFRSKAKIALADNEFAVNVDGVRHVYETDPHLAQALNGLGGDVSSQNIFLKLASGITFIKKIGITFTPDFIAKNLFRDQPTAGTFSTAGGHPFLGLIDAMKDIIGETEVYQAWQRSGGAGGSFLSVDEMYLTKDLGKLNEQTGFMDTAKNVISKPVHYLKLAGSLMENATRLNEFKKASAGELTGPKLLEAGFSAREVTVDFQRIGAKMSALNAITAFQNVSIQGLDRTIRAMKEDPAGVTMKGLAYLTAPSVALWWANKDDERYKEIPQWERDLFWIIPTDSWQQIKSDKELEGLPQYLIRKVGNSYEVNRGTVYRLPKPQELGLIFGTIPERMMEKFFTDNPRAMKNFGETVQNLITPSFIPDAITPFAEQFAGKSFFTQAPLIPYTQEKLLPEYQYTDYTSETAKQLGKLISKLPGISDIGPVNGKISSPLIIENYAKSWGGALGTYALQFMDRALTTAGVVKDLKPESSLADIPFIKSFVVRYPASNTRSLRDFRDRYAESEQVLATIDALRSRGDVESIDKVMQLHEQKMFQMRGVKDALGNIGHLIQMIHQDDTMNKSDKRMLIDNYYYMMITYAQTGLQAFDELDAQAKRLK